MACIYFRLPCGLQGLHGTSGALLHATILYVNRSRVWAQPGRGSKCSHAERLGTYVGAPHQTHESPVDYCTKKKGQRAKLPSRYTGWWWTLQSFTPDDSLGGQTHAPQRHRIFVVLPESCRYMKSCLLNGVVSCRCTPKAVVTDFASRVCLQYMLVMDHCIVRSSETTANMELSVTRHSLLPWRYNKAQAYVRWKNQAADSVWTGDTFQEGHQPAFQQIEYLRCPRRQNDSRQRFAGFHRHCCKRSS